MTNSDTGHDPSRQLVSVAELQATHRSKHSPERPAFVDLQSHSTASDGVLAPARVVETASALNLAAIALTDHDTLSGVDEAVAVGERLGVRVAPGIELGTHFEGNELHMLGLHIRNRDAIRDALRDFRSQRVARAEQIVDALNENGIPITLDAVLQEAGEGAVGRPHVARALIAGGWVSEFREAFDKWIGAGRPAYRPREHFDIVDAISLIHSSGGLAIWAHPAELATEARLRRLRELGLDGVEVLHPSHPGYLAQRIFDHARKLDLLPSGGSDWHGTGDGQSANPRYLGGQSVPALWLEMQDERLASGSGPGA